MTIAKTLNIYIPDGDVVRAVRNHLAKEYGMKKTVEDIEYDGTHISFTVTRGLWKGQWTASFEPESIIGQHEIEFIQE